MWEIITFKTKNEMIDFINKYGKKIQYQEIFINNGYGIEYRKLRKI